MTPRTLILDIETAPHLVLTWGLFQQNVSLDQIIKPGYILCWSAKWSGEPGTEFGAIWQGDGWLDKLHEMLSEADAVGHYNGETFDMPWLNGTFEKYGMDPLPTIPQIDLLKTVRKLRLASSKLDWAAREFLGRRKVHTGGFRLWLGVMGYLGDEAPHWAKMERYNRADVVLTDRLLRRFSPRITNLPNVGSAPGEPPTCPRPGCGSTRVHRRGVYRAKTREYPRYQCQKCRGWFKENKSEAAFGVAAI